MSEAQLYLSILVTFIWLNLYAKVNFNGLIDNPFQEAKSPPNKSK